MNLYLLKFNNYYNRIVQRYETIDEYGDYVLDVFTGVNFNPNNGVQAEQIVNYSGGDLPNYCIITDTSGEIVGRWYVIESIRVRAEQYRLLLYRDVIADWYDDVVSAPCFIEKATLQLGNPLLFNNENMTFNQIKQSEQLLKDKTGCPWIVGYYAKNIPNENLSGTIDTNDLNAVYDLSLNVPFEEWEYNATVRPYYIEPSKINYRIYAMNMTTSVGFQKQQGYLNFTKEGAYNNWTYVRDLSASLSCEYKGDIVGRELEPRFKANAASIYNNLKGYVDIPTAEETSYFLSLNGKIIKDSTGRVFQIAIRRGGIRSTVVDITAGRLFIQLSDICATSEYLVGTPNTDSFKVEIQQEECYITATELFGLSTTWDMTGERLVTEDAAYDIFAIPYGEITLKLGSDLVVKSNKAIGMAAANAIINKMSPSANGGFLYDIQLLPYCPIEAAEEGVIQFRGDEVEGRYSLIRKPASEGTDVGQAVGFILNISNSQFTKNILFNIPAPASAVEAKISNECDKYRLCSPNYNGYFDFSVAKNNGVSYFNVDCTYKPFQPYIHINPDFKGLYGGDFNDPRGLICGGDFSLSQVSDAWQSYQIQNKNFQEIFNRQIENMEVNNSVQRTLEKWNLATGTLQGVVTGGIAGSMMGGPAGAVGAVAGGVASLAGGIADIRLNEKLRNEALDFTKDLFGYQLGNIQALPYTLTKITSFTYNNKVFPTLEYYTCTDEEKQAFTEKLKYNGMTTMVIGKISDYIVPEQETYIKGQLIRFLTDKTADFNITNYLANELNKGVYIK